MTTHTSKLEIRRGDIFYAMFDGVGSEQQGKRPCIIIQNNTGNRHSPTVIVAMVTTQLHKARTQKTHTLVTRNDTSFITNDFRDSLVLCEQVQTIDKKRLMDKIASVKNMSEIDKCLGISFGMENFINLKVIQAVFFMLEKFGIKI